MKHTSLLLIGVLCVLVSHAQDCTPVVSVSAVATLSPQYDIITPGALSGCFSVGDGQYIRFSKGNLVYEDGTWSFAEHQYDYGDFFGYGTSTNPEQWSTNPDDYPQYQSIRQTNYDWGWYNPISNGGNTSHQWYTPGIEEWAYIFEQRPRYDELWGFATVAGVFGIVLLPDGWNGPALNTVKDYLANPFTEKEWAKMERLGAVFLPASGFNWYSGSGFKVQDVGIAGRYWAGTMEYNSTYRRSYIMNVLFYNNNMQIHEIGTAQCGSSVREVQSVTGTPTTIAYYPTSDYELLFNKVIPCAGGTVSITDDGHHNYTLTAIPEVGYAFYQWQETGSTNPTITNIHDLDAATTYTALFATGYTIILDDRGKQDTLRLFSNCATITTAPSANTPEGFVFQGWSTSPNGTIISFPYTPTQNETLYAVYTLESLIISADNATTAQWEVSSEMVRNATIIIRNGAVLTVSENNVDQQLHCQTIIIEAGGKMVIPVGTYITSDQLIMQGGDSVGASYLFLFPQLVVNGTLTLTNGTVYYDYLLNKKQQYALSLPATVTIADITYADGVAAVFNRDFYLMQYNGATRAQGQSGWTYLDGTTTQLQVGKGYTIFASPQYYQLPNGTMVQHTFSRLRLPMTVGTSFTESTRNISVFSYPSQTGKDNDAGWNLVGNPYLATYGNVGGLTSNGIGLLTLQSDGSYKWTGTQRYVVIPSSNGRAYYSQLAAKAAFTAFANFFVQIGAGDALSMPLANRAQNVPTRMLANNEEDEIATGIVLSNATTSDYVGILLGDNFSENYEINADLQKFGHNSGVNAYAYMDNEELAFVAVDKNFAANAIPIGYVAPTTGQYTFAIDETYDTPSVSGLLLYDSQEKVTTNLLHDNYSFTTAQGINNTRFSLSVITRTTPTNLPFPSTPDYKGKYITPDGRMFIFRAGKTYSVLGQRK